ncbi:SMC-Scp complex subunit ScpB [Candidatus Parcubacteria bacterium]|jgi:segregation and condensation protein B|nr:SMC-Scp complex subunit ScpB [Candidatus Parcubacteria bacterium]MBT3948463.1 SMC-Scp complex subunit ScpB [Candidatus Parcubacteria bacterium]
MDITSILESVLFVASKPLAIKKITKALGTDASKIEESLLSLEQKYTDMSGIHIARVGDTVQMITNTENVEAVEKFVKNEIQGELTKAQLETFTVVAYKGSITRPEIEEIRGVNCAVILRNLMIRGLVVEYDNKESVLPLYELSVDALRHLGVSSVSDLPDYESFQNHEHLNQEAQE